ncbi:hypothetical protein N1F78_07350 [Seonamhaeicola sp. MEBiC1930]|uniref:tetratricopeptide repeat protein n=1 Tax=Seonamhaeicola sp. MEBiC01930 TaxID=2976768 RepID=UPI00324747B2
MKTLLKYSLFILFINQISSQSIINGKIYYQHSGYMPAEKVKVKANHANETVSTSEGDFTLDFIANHVDEKANISIGTNNIGIDINGQEVELVNKHDLRYISIPNGIRDSIYLIICPKGNLDRETRRYYKIITSEAEKELKEIKARFRTIRKEHGISQDSIIKLNKLIENYEKLNDSASIYLDAQNIARINRDGASPRTIRFLNKLRAGKSIKEARKELSTMAAFKEANQGGSVINSRIEEIRTKANSFATEYKILEAIGQLDTINLIISNNKLEKIQQIENYQRIAKLYESINYFDKELSTLNKAWEVLDQYQYFFNVKGDLSRALSYCYRLKGNTSKALELLDQAEGFYKSHKLKNDNYAFEYEKYFMIDLARAQIYFDNKDLKNAKKYVTECLHFFNESKRFNVMGEDKVIPAKMLMVFISGVNLDIQGVETYTKEILNYFDKKGKAPIPIYLKPIEPEALILLGKVLVFFKKNMDGLDYLKKGLNKYEVLYQENQFLYAIRLAENYVIMAKLNNLFFSKTNKIEYLKKAMNYVGGAEKVIENYPYDNLKMEKISKDVLEQKNIINSVSDDILEYPKTMKIVSDYEEKIKASKNQEEKFLLQKHIVKEILKFTQKYPEFKKAKMDLGRKHGSLAWYALLNKDFGLAKISALKGLELSPNEDWINTNLALAFLLLDQYDQAKEIYLKYKDTPRGKATYRETFLKDIADLEKAGIVHNDFEKIKAILNE